VNFFIFFPLYIIYYRQDKLIVNICFYSQFLPLGKVPLRSFQANDIAFREDSAPIYEEILPIKEFPVKSKISNLLKLDKPTTSEERRCQ
jgi:hypothetical protein